MITLLIIIAIAALAIGHHAGHAHANYRHGRGGINLYWSSARGPWISVPARSAPGSDTNCYIPESAA